MAIRSKLDPEEPLKRAQDWCRFLSDALKHPEIDKAGGIRFRTTIKVPTNPPVSIVRICRPIDTQLLALADAIDILGGVAAWIEEGRKPDKGK